MMRTRYPGRCTRTASQEVGDAGIDMIPPHPAGTAQAQCRLIVGVELTQIVEGRAIHHHGHEAPGALRIADIPGDHLCVVAGAPDRAGDMVTVEVRLPAFVRRGVGERRSCAHAGCRTDQSLTQRSSKEVSHCLP